MQTLSGIQCHNSKIKIQGREETETLLRARLRIQNSDRQGAGKRGKTQPASAD